MVKVFFSYSHKDESLRNELDTHLSILKRNGIINSWHDRRIVAGTDFSKEIDSYLKNADIILLLISPDFLDSDYCYDNEMKIAMTRHDNAECIVIPVILRPCRWQDAPFGKLLAIPTDGKPVTKFSTLDDAFLDITTHLKNAAKKIEEKQRKIGKNDPVILTTSINPEERNDFRSANLKVKKKFTDHEKDQFLDYAFNYISKYFEGSLEELKKRNTGVEYRYKKLGDQTFSATLYLGDKTASECMIFYGGGLFFSKSINYSRNISDSRNSYNESLSIGEDGYMLFLQSSALSSIFGKTNPKEKLTNEGAAELFWSMFIEPLQH